MTVETPPEWDDALEDIRAIADMIRKIVAMRQLVGFYMGRLLRTVENLHLYADMQFVSLNHYVVEWLGISMRTARNLIKLVRSFLSLPVLEKAFKEGVLTQQRALLLLKVAKEKTEKEWLRCGTEIPVLELEREEKRLSRLIEANPNLLDVYRVLPGFVPPEKPGPGSETEAMNAEDDSSYAIEKISTTPVQMFATEKKSDAAGSGAFGSSVQMCATSVRPPVTGRYDDDGPWEVVLRKETVDVDDPSENETWKMIISDCCDCEEALHSQEDSGPEPEHVPGQDEIMLPDVVCHRGTDSTGKKCDAEQPADTADSEAAGSARKMSAAEAVSGSVTKQPAASPETSSGLNTVHSPEDGSAAIRFFIPDSLIPLWNYAFIRYLELAAGSEDAQESPSSADTAGGNASSTNTGTEIQLPPSAHVTHCNDLSSLLEGFLFSLIYHYL